MYKYKRRVGSFPVNTSNGEPLEPSPQTNNTRIGTQNSTSVLSNGRDTAQTPHQQNVDRPSKLLLDILIQIFKKRHSPTTLILLALLTWPHRLLLDPREMDL